MKLRAAKAKINTAHNGGKRAITYAVSQLENQTQKEVECESSENQLENEEPPKKMPRVADDEEISGKPTNENSKVCYTSY